MRAIAVFRLCWNGLSELTSQSYLLDLPFRPLQCHVQKLQLLILRFLYGEFQFLVELIERGNDRVYVFLFGVCFALISVM